MKRLEEAHKKTGEGLAKLLLPIVAGVFIAASPTGQKAYNTLRQYVNQKIITPEEHRQTPTNQEYNGNSDLRQLAGYKDKHFRQEEYTK